MKTFYRICIEDFERTDNAGNKFEVKRGKEYITSEIEDGYVTVFCNFWVKVPESFFAGAKEFTG